MESPTPRHTPLVVLIMVLVVVVVVVALPMKLMSESVLTRQCMHLIVGVLS